MAKFTATPHPTEDNTLVYREVEIGQSDSGKYQITCTVKTGKQSVTRKDLRDALCKQAKAGKKNSAAVSSKVIPDKLWSAVKQVKNMRGDVLKLYSTESYGSRFIDGLDNVYNCIDDLFDVRDRCIDVARTLTSLKGEKLFDDWDAVKAQMVEDAGTLLLDDHFPTQETFVNGIELQVNITPANMTTGMVKQAADNAYDDLTDYIETLRERLAKPSCRFGPDGLAMIRKRLTKAQGFDPDMDKQIGLCLTLLAKAEKKGAKPADKKANVTAIVKAADKIKIGETRKKLRGLDADQLAALADDAKSKKDAPVFKAVKTEFWTRI